MAIHTFPYGTTLRQIERTPDGDGLLVLMDMQAINFWAAICWWWPEIVTTLVLAATLTIIWRVWRRREVANEWRCKNCHYALVGLRSERCPECGTLLTDRTRVRSRLRRRAWRIALVATLLAAFALLYVNRFPGTRRTGEFSTWMHWNSVAAFDRAVKANNNTLVQHAQPMATVARVDPKNGTVTNVILQEPESALEVVLHDNSESFLLRGQTSLAQFDLATGREIRSIDLAGTKWFPHWADFIHAAAPAGRLNAVHILTSNELLLEWNLKNGQVQQIGEAPKPTSWHSTNAGLTPQQRGAYRNSGNAGEFLLVGGEGPQQFTPPAEHVWNDRIAVHPNEPKGYFTMPGGDVWRFALHQAGQSHPIAQPPVPVGTVAISRDGAWLFARANFGNDVLLYDTVRQRWRARLSPPPGNGQLLTGVILADNTTAAFVLIGPAGQAIAIYSIPD